MSAPISHEVSREDRMMQYVEETSRSVTQMTELMREMMTLLIPLVRSSIAAEQSPPEIARTREQAAARADRSQARERARARAEAAARERAQARAERAQQQIRLQRMFIERKQKVIKKAELEKETEDICSICFEKHKLKDSIVTSCRHVFGYKCFEQYINANLNSTTRPCPICRTPHYSLMSFKARKSPTRKNNTPQPAPEPAPEPAYEPTYEPAHEPTYEPTHEPAYEPAYEPAHEIIVIP